MTYRLIYVGLGLLALAAVVLGAAFGSGSDPIELPSPIERLIPQPGDAVLPQAVLEIDLEAGYLAQIVVDGHPIPESEVIFVESTGVHRWQPSPGGLVFSEWTPGIHTVVITWDSLAGLPDPGQFEWSFRVQ
jgi:hypothetical protein